MSIEVDDMTVDSSIGGSEVIPVSDGGAPKSITPAGIGAYTIDLIEAIAASGSASLTDHVFTLQSGVLKPETVAIVTQAAIDGMWGKAAESSPDSADILLLKDGGTTEKTVTLALLAEYVRATVQAAILDVSDLTVHSSIIGADKFLVTSGTTGKYCTYTVLSAAIYASLAAHIIALTAHTSPGDTDLLYVLQGGTTPKKITLAYLKTVMGTTIAPGSTTENSIPQWDSASKTLKDGLTLQSTVRATASAVDTALPTEKAVRTLASSIVYNQTDIAADIEDADLIMVDDGAVGTAQRKSTFTRVWAWIVAHLVALGGKSDGPVGADRLTIIDTEDTNALKTLTLSTLKSFMDGERMALDRFRLVWNAGARGKPGVNGDIQNAAESTRMVTDPDFELLGTNAVSTDVTFYAEGGIVMETGGDDGDEDILCPHLDANQSAWSQVTWGTDKAVQWECRIKTGSNITNCIIWAGLKKTMTEVTITDTDQVFFRYEDDNNTGKWEAISSIGGSDDEADTGVTVAINTDYHLVIKIQNDRSAKFYINDVLVETSAALTDATDLIPYIGVAADGAAAAKSLIVRGQAIIRDFA